MTREEMKVLLEQAWKEVFKTGEVSENADFFEAGGDSIMAVQLSAWLVQKGVKLDLVDVFMTPKFSELAEKLSETEPYYVPDALLTKELAAREMGFGGAGDAQEAEKNPMGSIVFADAGKGLDSQQVCDQKVCDQQVCSPMLSWQLCTPMNWQQVCSPMYGSQQVCSPMYGSQQICTPMYGSQQVCTPMYGSQQVCTPMYGSQQICSPMYGNQQVCSPMYGGQQVCTPMNGSQQVCTPNAGQPQTMPPQLLKYMSHAVEKPVEEPNVIKIEKAKVAEKKVSAEDALLHVMKGLLPNFNKEVDFFEQGLTSFDTVKMVTRIAEQGYVIEMKDIYLHSTFDELVGCMK